ncbi:hypothetical protein [Yunchengibacter salinarum]|uniref:hypothetical protein n=1 Tax=Yunchengibacter salinarum TaxID=3133399 RepID=UPI0035B699DA
MTASATTRPVHVVGPLPPSPSLAAEMTQALAEALSERYQVTCVIDDLMPQPTGLATGITVVRLSDLLRNTGGFRASQRLYVLGDSGDCAHGLDLLARAPGAVFLAENSLFNLMQERLSLDGDWPAAFLEHLIDQEGEAARPVVRGFNMRPARRPDHLPDLVRVLDLHASERTETVVGSVLSARLALAASLSPLRFLRPLVPAPGPADGLGRDAARAQLDLPRTDFIIVARRPDSPADRDRLGQVITDLKRQDKPVHLVTASKGVPTLDSLIRAADCVVDLEAPLGKAGSVLVHRAMMLGTATITPALGWGQDLPGNATLHVAPGYGEELAVALGALITQPALRQRVQATARTFAAETLTIHAQADELTELIDRAPLLPVNRLEELMPPPPEPPASYTISRRFEGAPVAGRMALFGAPPGADILQAAFPDMAVATSPRFATLWVAETLARETGLPAPIALDRMGFESPLAQAAGDRPDADRRAAELGLSRPPLEDLAAGLQPVEGAITFGRSPVEDTLWFTDWATAPQPPRWTFQLDVTRLLAPPRRERAALGLQGTGGGTPVVLDPAGGRIISLIRTRRVVRLVMLTGLSGRYRLRLTTPPDAGRLVFSSDYATGPLGPDGQITLTADSGGILRVSMALLNTESGGLAPVDTLLEALGATGFIMERD